MTLGRVRYSAKTHRGMVRQINEDSILALPESGVWMVSDGMGGHSGGDFASQTVTEALASLPADLSGEELVESVRRAILSAHELIRREVAVRHSGTIGATVVAVLLLPAELVGFWAGDSRLYRLRSGTLDMLSSDHSLVGELVRANQITWDEAERHPQSHVIQRAVGVGDMLDLEMVRTPTYPGDRYLICSDGLTRYATAAVLCDILEKSAIETVGDRLMDLAISGGGADNISLIVLDLPATSGRTVRHTGLA